MLCRARAVGAPGKAARRIVGALSDIHERKQLEEQLRQGALYDTVTGLPNRRLFLDRLTWAVEQSQRRDGTRFAVVFLDLDGFKLINDSLGHLMGDLLLQAVGERLRSDLRSVDTAARFGGDEFAVLLYGLKSEAVLSIVERLQERIAEPVMLGETEVSVTASIGIASSDTGYTSAEDVLRDADIAMYHAKEVERGTASVFDPVMHTRATGRLRAQSELRAALVGHQFVMHYQPVVALDGSALTQFEALVRWEHPERGLLLPADFLPIMAESGTIVVLGQWIVEAVCEQIAAWRRAYDGPLAVSVNLSHREFWSDQLLLTVTQALSRHHVPPACLILEITESVIMADPDAAREIMGDLHANGIRMHIDDFGTGQSSLHALRAFPVDALKIDQSFVQQIDVDRQTTELVRIIVGMGHTLGLDVVAEGVETTEQAESLRAMGCGTAQGWLYAKAIPGDEAGLLLGMPLAEQPPVPVGSRPPVASPERGHGARHL
jgi:diguanylate cyclase (GGDEF)-like protein